jgi:hypothetical protein
VKAYRRDVKAKIHELQISALPEDGGQYPDWNNREQEATPD